MDPKKVSGSYTTYGESFLARVTPIFDEMMRQEMYSLWSSYQTYIPRTTYVTLPPEDWELENWKNALDTLIAITKVIIRAWYEDLMQDDARQRFSLLELD